METSNYIVSLFKPTTKAQSRKVWSIDLETVWLPFFTATNTTGITAIQQEALGCPLRLAYNPDGSVKFNEKTGKPVIRVAKDISDSVKLVRENFIAGLQNFTHQVCTEHEQAYQDMVKACLASGRPIANHDKNKLNEAMAKAVEQAMAETEAKEQEQEQARTKTKKPDKEKELVHA